MTATIERREVPWKVRSALGDAESGAHLFPRPAPEPGLGGSVPAVSIAWWPIRVGPWDLLARGGNRIAEGSEYGTVAWFIGATAAGKPQSR